MQMNAGMASKSYSFRLPPELEAVVEKRRNEGETSNQALQREVIAYLSSGIEAPSDQSLRPKKEIAEIIEEHTTGMLQRIEALEGKLIAWMLGRRNQHSGGTIKKL